MIEFKVDPPSGHAESCLDIRFMVKVDKADRMQIEIFNETINTRLELLSVSKGVISEERTAIVKRANFVEGYVNLFNKDKMNSRLTNLVKVDLKCVVQIELDGKTTTEEAVLPFYNESQSLDSHIIPFDLILDNHEIDIKNNIPLSMQIVCDAEEKYELAVKSTAGEICTFEVVTKKGRNQVILPSEILWHELGIHKNIGGKCQLYWVKFEGIDHMKYVNRKYVPIAESTITFNDVLMSPRPQQRLGPTGKDLTPDFVLSHRYFVPTFQDFTSLGEIANQSRTASETNVNRIRFLHETQSLERKEVEKIEAMSSSDSERLAERKKQMAAMRSIPQPDPRQRLLINAYKKAYTRKLAMPRTDKAYVKYAPTNHPVKTMSGPKSGGCGCSRTKNA